MRIAVIVGLLIASTGMGVNAPSPRPSVEGNRKTSENTKQAHYNQPSPPPLPSPVSKDSTDRDKNQSSSPQSDSGKGSIGVHAVQPATIKTDKSQPLGVSTVKDWWDKTLILATVLLVVVGAFGVQYAIKTLRAIGVQTDAIRDTVQIQKEGLRARLVIQFGDSPIPRINSGMVPVVTAKIVNIGAIPAYGVIPETWIEIASHPFTDFSSTAVYFEGEKISVYPQRPTLYDIPLARQITDAERTGLVKGTSLLCFRIRLRYEDDVFNKSRHADFGFIVRSNGMEVLPKYNDAS